MIDYNKKVDEFKTWLAADPHIVALAKTLYSINPKICTQLMELIEIVYRRGLKDGRDN